jgi:hypothetical protein
MDDKRGSHLKVQELVDCFATTNPLEEMSKLSSDQDQEEAAHKWLALAALHAVTAGATKVKLTVAADGEVAVKAKYRESELPSPGPEVGARIVELVRGITHFEKDKAKGPLALGMRNDSLEIQVKVSRKQGRDKITLEFPEK